MSTSDAIADAQMQHLLEVVDRHREEECTRLIEHARTQARQIVKAAWRDARVRTHEDILELREQIRRQVASADARRQTRQRQLRQEASREFISAAWQPLRETLERRWQQQTTRQQWVNDLVEQASKTLIDAHWSIEHPPEWPGQECNDLKAKLSNSFDCFPSFTAQATISAGLRICAGGACVDGTIEGLLHRRTRVEALLLARFSERHIDSA